MANGKISQVAGVPAVCRSWQLTTPSIIQYHQLWKLMLKPWCYTVTSVRFNHWDQNRCRISHSFKFVHLIVVIEVVVSVLIRLWRTVVWGVISNQKSLRTNIDFKGSSVQLIKDESSYFKEDCFWCKETEGAEQGNLMEQLSLTECLTVAGISWPSTRPLCIAGGISLLK